VCHPHCPLLAGSQATTAKQPPAPFIRWTLPFGPSSPRSLIRAALVAKPSGAFRPTTIACLGPTKLDSHTSAFCQARARLPLEDLQQINHHLSQTMEQLARTPLCGLSWGQPLRLVDGTALTMPDTPRKIRPPIPNPASRKRAAVFPANACSGTLLLGQQVGLAGFLRTQPMSTDEIDSSAIVAPTPAPGLSSWATVTSAPTAM